MIPGSTPNRRRGVTPVQPRNNTNDVEQEVEEMQEERNEVEEMQEEGTLVPHQGVEAARRSAPTAAEHAKTAAEMGKKQLDVIVAPQSSIGGDIVVPDSIVRQVVKDIQPDWITKPDNMNAVKPLIVHVIRMVAPAMRAMHDALVEIGGSQQALLDGLETVDSKLNLMGEKQDDTRQFLRNQAVVVDETNENVKQLVGLARNEKGASAAQLQKLSADLEQQFAISQRYLAEGNQLKQNYDNLIAERDRIAAAVARKDEEIVGLKDQFNEERLRAIKAEEDLEETGLELATAQDELQSARSELVAYNPANDVAVQIEKLQLAHREALDSKDTALARNKTMYDELIRKWQQMVESEQTLRANLTETQDELTLARRDQQALQKTTKEKQQLEATAKTLREREAALNRQNAQALKEAQTAKSELEIARAVNTGKTDAVVSALREEVALEKQRNAQLEVTEKATALQLQQLREQTAVHKKDVERLEGEKKRLTEQQQLREIAQNEEKEALQKRIDEAQQQIVLHGDGGKTADMEKLRRDKEEAEKELREVTETRVREKRTYLERVDELERQQQEGGNEQLAVVEKRATQAEEALKKQQAHLLHSDAVVNAVHRMQQYELKQEKTGFRIVTVRDDTAKQQNIAKYAWVFPKSSVDALIQALRLAQTGAGAQRQPALGAQTRVPDYTSLQLQAQLRGLAQSTQNNGEYSATVSFFTGSAVYPNGRERQRFTHTRVDEHDVDGKRRLVVDMDDHAHIRLVYVAGSQMRLIAVRGLIRYQVTRKSDGVVVADSVGNMPYAFEDIQGMPFRTPVNYVTDALEMHCDVLGAGLVHLNMLYIQRYDPTRGFTTAPVRADDNV